MKNLYTLINEADFRSDKRTALKWLNKSMELAEDLQNAMGEAYGEIADIADAGFKDIPLYAQNLNDHISSVDKMIKDIEKSINYMDKLK
jgi:hypothetical protein